MEKDAVNQFNSTSANHWHVTELVAGDETDVALPADALAFGPFASW